MEISEFVETEDGYIVFDAVEVTVFSYSIEDDIWFMVEYTFNRTWELR